MRTINSFRSVLPVYVLLLSVLFSTSPAQNTTKEELLEKLQKMNISWTPGLNPTEMPANYTKFDSKNKPFCPKCRPRRFRLGTVPPRFFDTRNKWRATCAKILNRIRHQGQCDSSWAVATASMVSDRLCISTGGKIQVHLSAEHLLNCCNSCRIGANPGCQGGAPDEAIHYVNGEGVVTGGEVNSGEGCMPYSTDSFEGLNQDCPKECTNKNYQKTKQDDRYKGADLYTLPSNSEDVIRQELFEMGPVLAQMTVYEDLEFYKRGVYINTLGDSQGTHFVKIIGYGVEDGKKYWLLANSHGVAFGSKGFVKLLRGVNHCNIEMNVLAVGVKEKNIPTPPGEEEPDENAEYSDEIEYRAAAIDDADTAEPSMGKYVLFGFIFCYCYLRLYN